MSGIASFIAGLGTGYVQGSHYQDEQARLKKKDAMDQETHDLQVSEARQKQANEKALRDAAAPATVDQGAGGMTKPPTADNIDVGQPGEPGADNGGLVPGALVNGQASTDPKATAAAYDAPGARQARMIGAMESTGDYKGAAELKASDLKTQAATQQMADSVWKHDLGAAMQGGHDGLAQLVSQSQSGAMAGKNVKAVPSADGKSVTYNVVGDDGTLTPTSLTFSNDQNGVTQAAYMLDKTVTPDHRVDYALKASKNAADVAESTAKAGYYSSFAAQKDALTANGGAAPKRGDHFDEKAWNDAFKVDKSIVSYPNPLTDKDVDSGDLRQAHKQVFNALRASGNYAPQEAVAEADSAVLKIKALAQQQVDQAKAADPKSPLTMDQAVRTVTKAAMAQATAAQAAAQKAPQAGPANTVIAPNGHPTVTPGAQSSMDTDAGVLMVKSQFHGDLKAAAAELAQTQAAAAQAKGDAKGIIQSYANRLQAGITALSSQQQAPAPVAPRPARPAAQGITAPTTAPAPPVAASVGVPPPDPGAALDGARQAYAAAVAKLSSYGARQQAKDPQGFAQAKLAVQAADQARAQAEAAYSKTVGGVQPAFTAARM